MAEPSLCRTLRSLAGIASESDLDLLGRWADSRDESAFELLVWRYGAMVLAACRRVLPSEDAADAFQATFLVLVRKAAAVGRRGSLGGWLHRVAVRVSRAARKKAARGVLPLTTEPPARPELEPVDGTRDLRQVLDEELDHLPERFRQVLVKCYLQGKTAAEAAHELGCARGTVLSRLLRGRERLKQRLIRRGLALSAAAGLGVFEEVSAAATSRLVAATVDVAVGRITGCEIPGSAPELAREVLNIMWRKTVKTFALTMLVVGGLGLGLGTVWLPSGVIAAPQAATQDAPIDVPQAKPPAGKALPPAVAARTPVQKVDPKKELEKLKGNWQIVTMMMGGEKLPDEIAKKMGYAFGAEKITIKGKLAQSGGQYVVRDGSEDFNFTIDPSKKVAEINIEIGDQEFAKGIYKFDGDELILCIDYSRADRPTKFESKDNPAHALYTLKKEKN